MLKTGSFFRKFGYSELVTLISRRIPHSSAYIVLGGYASLSWFRVLVTKMHSHLFSVSFEQNGDSPLAWTSRVFWQSDRSHSFQRLYWCAFELWLVFFVFKNSDRHLFFGLTFSLSMCQPSVTRANQACTVIILSVQHHYKFVITHLLVKYHIFNHHALGLSDDISLARVLYHMLICCHKHTFFFSLLVWFWHRWTVYSWRSNSIWKCWEMFYS